jgi:hypothetical protein
MIDTGLDTTVEISLMIVGFLYLLAGVFNLFIPDTGVPHKPLNSSPTALLADFGHSFRALWQDKLGQISLAVTTLFWGAGATLQFIVIDWADRAMGMGLSQASKLQGVVAVGIAIGAVMAARRITLRGSVRVIPLGIAMGLLVPLMIFVTSLWTAIPLLVMIGACAGFFVVPMNALLQHRGHMLMGAGHSIAVQNFNENLSILIMTGLYAALLAGGLSVFTVMISFGCSLPARCSWWANGTRRIRRGATTWRCSTTAWGTEAGASAQAGACEAEIFPDLGLVLRIAQQVGRMVGHHDRYAGTIEQPAARSVDLHFRAEQGLRSRASQCHDDARPDQRDLTLEIGMTGGNLVGFRRPVAGWSALHRIRDIDVAAAGKSDRRQHRIEQLAGLTDKGLAALILFRAGAFSDEQPVRLPVADTRHRHRATFMQRAGAAGTDRAFQRVPVEVFGRDAGTGHRRGCDTDLPNRIRFPNRGGWHGRCFGRRFDRCIHGAATQAPDWRQPHFPQHGCPAAQPRHRSSSSALITIASSRPSSAG